MANNKISIKGFTLIEMLIVIAIIAILSSVVLAGLPQIRNSAYDSRRTSDLQHIQSYLETFYNQDRVYPSSGNWEALNSSLIEKAGISKVPNDPLVHPDGTGGYVYCYSSTDQQGYILGAKLSSVSAAKDSWRGNAQSGYTCTEASIDCSAGSNWYCLKF